MPEGEGGTVPVPEGEGEICRGLLRPGEHSVRQTRDVVRDVRLERFWQRRLEEFLSEGLRHRVGGFPSMLTLVGGVHDVME